MEELLISIARGLVEQPDEVRVDTDEPAEDGTIVYHLHVAENDMGRVIGKQGRIAKAIRLVMRAAATKKCLVIKAVKSLIMNSGGDALEGNTRSHPEHDG